MNELWIELQRHLCEALFLAQVIQKQRGRENLVNAEEGRVLGLQLTPEMLERIWAPLVADLRQIVLTACCAVRREEAKVEDADPGT